MLRKREIRIATMSQKTRITCVQKYTYSTIRITITKECLPDLYCKTGKKSFLCYNSL